METNDDFKITKIKFNFDKKDTTLIRILFGAKREYEAKNGKYSKTPQDKMFHSDYKRKIKTNRLYFKLVNKLIKVFKDSNYDFKNDDLYLFKSVLNKTIINHIIENSKKSSSYLRATTAAYEFIRPVCRIYFNALFIAPEVDSNPSQSKQEISANYFELCGDDRKYFIDNYEYFKKIATRMVLYFIKVTQTEPLFEMLDNKIKYFLSASNIKEVLPNENINDYDRHRFSFLNLRNAETKIRIMLVYTALFADFAKLVNEKYKLGYDSNNEESINLLRYCALCILYKNAIIDPYSIFRKSNASPINTYRRFKTLYLLDYLLSLKFYNGDKLVLPYKIPNDFAQELSKEDYFPAKKDVYVYEEEENEKPMETTNNNSNETVVYSTPVIKKEGNENTMNTTVNEVIHTTIKPEVIQNTENISDKESDICKDFINKMAENEFNEAIKKIDDIEDYITNVLCILTDSDNKFSVVSNAAITSISNKCKDTINTLKLLNELYKTKN